MFAIIHSVVLICSFLHLLTPTLALSNSFNAFSTADLSTPSTNTSISEHVKRQNAAAKECRGAVLNTTISPETNSMMLRWNLQSLQKGLYAGPPQDFLECSLSLSLGQSWQFAATGVNWVGRARLLQPGMLLKTSIRFYMGNISPRQYSWTLSAPSDNNFMLRGDIPPANQIWTSCSDTVPMNVDWYTKLITIDPAASGGILWVPPPTNEPFHVEVQFELRPCGQPGPSYPQQQQQPPPQAYPQPAPAPPRQSYPQQNRPQQSRPAQSYPRPSYPQQQASPRPNYPQVASPRPSSSYPRQPYQQQGNAFQQQNSAYSQQNNAYSQQNNQQGVNSFTPVFKVPRQSFAAEQVNAFVPVFGAGGAQAAGSSQKRDDEDDR